MDTRRFLPVVITLSPEEADSMSAEFDAQRADIVSIGLSRFKSLFFGRAILMSQIARCNPSVIHSHGLRPDVLMAGIQCHCPRMSTLHNYPYIDYPMKFGSVRGLPAAWQHLRALRRLDLVVACSKAISDQVAQHGVPTRVVQNGVDDSVFCPAEVSERRRLREALGLPLESMVVVSVGSFITRKDPMTVIRGFLLSRLSHNGLLVMLGSGRLQESCERYAAGRGNIRLLGQVSNVVDYLRASDIFVSASHAEGLPNTVLEALACGLPVCISEISPHIEILVGSTNVGYTFPVGNCEALAHALDACGNGNLTAPCHQAMDLILHNFSARIMSENYQRLYDELICKWGKISHL